MAFESRQGSSDNNISASDALDFNLGDFLLTENTTKKVVKKIQRVKKNSATNQLNPVTEIVVLSGSMSAIPSKVPELIDLGGTQTLIILTESPREKEEVKEIPGSYLCSILLRWGEDRQKNIGLKEEAAAKTKESMAKQMEDFKVVEQEKNVKERPELEDRLNEKYRELQNSH
ncbi:hypothetical protein ACH5RR_033983 [Cinchona calisaya]|uniref:Uncharacterized protein n=1 Tax=Cinchona calisaya TaxID=153742 RepID=A0ABD2YCJ4_9GENT